jgi:hypothetical protein
MQMIFFKPTKEGRETSYAGVHHLRRISNIVSREMVRLKSLIGL